MYIIRFLEILNFFWNERHQHLALRSKCWLLTNIPQASLVHSLPRLHLLGNLVCSLHIYKTNCNLTERLFLNTVYHSQLLSNKTVFQRPQIIDKIFTDEDQLSLLKERSIWQRLISAEWWIYLRSLSTTKIWWQRHKLLFDSLICYVCHVKCYGLWPQYTVAAKLSFMKQEMGIWSLQRRTREAFS